MGKLKPRIFKWLVQISSWAGHEPRLQASRGHLCPDLGVTDDVGVTEDVEMIKILMWSLKITNVGEIYIHIHTIPHNTGQSIQSTVTRVKCILSVQRQEYEVRFRGCRSVWPTGVAPVPEDVAGPIWRGSHAHYLPVLLLQLGPWSSSSVLRSQFPSGKKLPVLGSRYPQTAFRLCLPSLNLI